MFEVELESEGEASDQDVGSFMSLSENGENGSTPVTRETEIDKLVPKAGKKRQIRKRNYKKDIAIRPHFYAKDELTKKILRDIREKLYKSFISHVPRSKLNNKYYQLTFLKKWLNSALGIADYNQFDEDELITVFCHLRVRKIRARLRG